MPPPTHYQTADMDRRHERHGCPAHPAPGICVADGQPWPCDARRLLDLAAASPYAGTLIREAQAVTRAWSAWAGAPDAGPGAMASAVTRLAAVLDTIGGTRADPLTPAAP